MAKIVNSWNDWDPLKRVIVGRCDNSVIPPEEPATSEKVPVDSEMRGMWGLRPLRTVERGNECLENLVKAVEERGVVVDRPTPLQWNQAIGTPDFRNDSMMTCMPPRDILLTVGNEIMASANSFRCRYFEYLAYWPLMKQYFDEDPEFLWTQAPRPRLTDASYKHNYYDEKITLEERRELIILELTVKYNGIIYRAEQSAKDKNDALDVTVDRVIRQIRKQKTKVEKSLRTGAFEGLAPEAEEKEYEVIREKKFHLRPMSVDEAILQMNLLDHTFFMFKNADTGAVNVVYKRDEGNYAVLVPEG